MKTKFKVIAASLCVLALAALTSSAAGVYYGTGPNPVNSTLGGTNINSATNGVYPAGIGGGVTITNWVRLNNGTGQPGLLGNTVVVGLQGQSSSTTTSTTNVTAVLYAAPVGETVTVTNNAATGWNVPANIGQFSYFGTITLTLPATGLQSTNVVYSINSTPAFAGGLNLWLGTISYQGAGSAPMLTNYNVYVVQQ